MNSGGQHAGPPGNIDRHRSDQDGKRRARPWSCGIATSATGPVLVTESELAFHTQDTAGNTWNLGEYPRKYTRAGSLPRPQIPGSRACRRKGQARKGAYHTGKSAGGDASVPPGVVRRASSWIAGRCPKTGQHICNITGCYDKCW